MPHAYSGNEAELGAGPLAQAKFETQKKLLQTQNELMKLKPLAAKLKSTRLAEAVDKALSLISEEIEPVFEYNPYIGRTDDQKDMAEREIEHMYFGKQQTWEEHHDDPLYEPEE